jgi:hypothetical protein
MSAKPTEEASSNDADELLSDDAPTAASPETAMEKGGSSMSMPHQNTTPKA